MPKFFVTNKQIENNKIFIIGQDVNHIKKVLRTKIGDELEICNVENQQNFLCQIEEIENEKIICKIKEKVEETSESNIQITVYQGLPKSDKMEYIIQKSVELGVYDITPVEMQRCVVKLNDKDKIKKQERWQKISEVASKQSGRDIIPKINNIKNIKNIVNEVTNYDLFLIAYEKEKDNTLKNELSKIKNNKENMKIAILIGPEGGLEETDTKLLQQKGAKIITLGKRILRTETVALSVISIIMYELEQ